MKWRIAKVMSKLEERFILDLSLKGLEAGLADGRDFYCPFVPVLTKPKGKRQPVAVNYAAYPGYAFVSEAAAGLFGDLVLKRMAGFRGFMAFRGEFVLIRACEVDQMKEHEKGWQQMAKDRAGIVLVNGDRVRVSSGMMAGEDGIVLGLFGQWAEVKFRADWPPVRIRVELLERA